MPVLATGRLSAPLKTASLKDGKYLFDELTIHHTSGVRAYLNRGDFLARRTNTGQHFAPTIMLV